MLHHEVALRLILAHANLWRTHEDNVPDMASSYSDLLRRWEIVAVHNFPDLGTIIIFSLQDSGSSRSLSPKKFP